MSSISHNLSEVLKQEQSNEHWKVTNDSVMGGLSVGKVQRDNNISIFSGELCIDNAPRLKAANISHIGLLISSKQAKTFSLSIHSIQFNE